MNQQILIADDEVDMLNLVGTNLSGAGFIVHKAEDGPAAVAAARQRLPHLIVLDLMMPGMTGLEVCRVLKNDATTESIPIVLLTARGGEADRILAFELGADDYVTKPFSPRELVLRIRGILKRSTGMDPERAMLQAGDIRLDADRHEIYVRGRPVELTAIEFRLLATLMERRGRVQSRDSLLSAVWGVDRDIESRTVDTHLRRLREKLGSAGDQIRTVRGFGYRLDEI